jgi:hypothetical protein
VPPAGLNAPAGEAGRQAANARVATKRLRMAAGSAGGAVCRLLPASNRQAWERDMVAGSWPERCPMIRKSGVRRRIRPAWLGGGVSVLGDDGARRATTAREWLRRDACDVRGEVCRIR